MRIKQLHPDADWTLAVISDDGRTGRFDVKPYLDFEAFQSLRDLNEFQAIFNGGYFVEWACGADLSADTIDARWTHVVTQGQGRAA